MRVLGSVEALKLRSSMTLFARAARDDTHARAARDDAQEAVFRSVLTQYFRGVEDPETVRLLRA